MQSTSHLTLRTAREVARVASHREPARTALLLVAALLASCTGKGGTGLGGGGTVVPDTSTGFLPTVSLTSAVGGAGTLRVEWEALDAGGSAVPVALFRATDPSLVFQGAPVVAPATGGAALWTGLTDGVDYFVGLAIDEGGGSYAPAGPVLCAHTGAPIYVDLASTAATPDGLTPQTAFSSPIAGLLTALAAGGGNVWIAAGDYSVSGLPLGSGVHLFGGFDAAFDLATRDATTHVTRLVAASSLAVLEAQGGGATVVVDGIAIEGNGASNFGLDFDDTSFSVRNSTISNCAGRGVRLRSVETGSSRRGQFVRSLSTMNGADGLSLAGPWELELDSSRFEANGQEGAEFGDLLAPDGESIKALVRNCRFFGNADEGLDVDLAAPPFGGSAGSKVRIAVEGSVFELNGRAGLLIDIDFELVVGWEAEILLRGITARNNAAAGVHLDLDWTAQTWIQRSLATANAGDGFTISSESAPGVAFVSTSAAIGNLGAGIRGTFGQVPVVATHCVLAGNALGGFVGDTVESSLVSSLGWNQPALASGARTWGTVAVDPPQSSPFVHAAREHLRVDAVQGATLSLGSLGTLAGSDQVELAGDGVARDVTGFGAASVDVDPAPTAVATPTTLAVFGPGAGVSEDYTLVAGSIALGAGLAPPAGSPPDAGIFGSPTAGPPGREDTPVRPLLRPSSVAPPPSQTIQPLDTIRIEFAGGTLAPASVDALSVRAVLDSGLELAVLLGVANDVLTLDPPPGGWGTQPFRVELHAGLRSTAGDGLAAPVALAFRP